MTDEIFAIRQGVKLSLQTLPYEIIKRLSELHIGLYPSASPDTFTKDHFEPMLNDPKLDPTAMEQFIYTGMDEKDVQYIDLLRQSCAYCVATIRADKRGERNVAWMLACFAQYWLGLANGIRFVSGAGELAISLKAQKAGKGSNNAKYGAAADLARELAKKYTDGTAANAARMIKPEILAFLSDTTTKYKNLSEQNAERTIAGWLSTSDLTFQGARGPRKPNVKR